MLAKVRDSTGPRRNREFVGLQLQVIPIAIFSCSIMTTSSEAERVQPCRGAQRTPTAGAAGVDLCAPRGAGGGAFDDEREVLLKGRLRAALMRLNEWMTEEQAERAIFELEHVDSTGMARNQAVHEYLTYGMPLTVDGPQRDETRAPFASSTSTTRRAASTSSSPPRSSASGAATSEAAQMTTSAWSSPTWCCSSTASP